MTLIKDRFILRAVLILCLVSTSVYAKQKQPNILWIVCEDMSQDLACYGNKLVKTPTLDKLADQGMRFTNMYTTAGICSPSRTALAIGMHQASIDAMHMRYPESLKSSLPEGVKTVSHWLSSVGYQTLGLGKDDYMFSLNSPSFQYKRLDQIDAKKPYFAKVNSHFTHRKFAKDSKNPIDPEDIDLPPYYANVVPLREDWAAYLENIQLLDSEIKATLDRFEVAGLLENTIVFFLSDHGRPMMRAKTWAYDASIQIPFMVYCTSKNVAPINFHPGTVDHELHSAIDISATTLALAGVDRPEKMQGHVFLGDTKMEKRKYIFSSVDRVGGLQLKTRAVRSKQYKYIRNYKNGQSILESSTEYRKTRLPHYYTTWLLNTYNKLNEVQECLVRPLPPEELYDVIEDPFEVHNLIGETKYKEVHDQLAEKLVQHLRYIQDKGLQEDSQQLQEHFNSYREKGRKSYAKERLQTYKKIKKVLQEDGILE